MKWTLENIILAGIAAGVAAFAWLYYTGRVTMNCQSWSGRSKNYFTSGTPSTGCGYLAESLQGQGVDDEEQINVLCSQYQQVCGNGSASSEILSLGANNINPNDPDHVFRNTLQQDVVEVKLDNTKCAPLLSCNLKKAIDCPPFLTCSSGACR